MDSRLILLIEEDYILPVSIDADGKTHAYSKDDENRLWLYFYVEDHRVDFSEKYKVNCDAEENAYVGSVWKKMLAGEMVGINGRDVPAFNLLSQSLVLKNIRDFYLESTGDDGHLPVTYIFADSLSNDLRKKIMIDMEKQGFKTVSYSHSLSALFVDYINKNHNLSYNFGDNVVLINSAADVLRVTAAVYDGENWLTDSKCRIFENIGSAPFRKALVRYVVNEVDKKKGALRNDREREYEYAFQYKNVDKWLAVKKNANGDFDISDFAYSSDLSIKYSCHISGRFLDAVLDEVVRNTSGLVSRYVKENIGSDVVRAVVVSGPAFDDEAFVEKTKTEFGGKLLIWLAPERLSDVIAGLFNTENFEKDEPLDKFDIVCKRSEANGKAVSAWVKSAAKIRNLWVNLEAEVPSYISRVDEDVRLFDDMIKSCDNSLKHSQFETAVQKLLTYQIPSPDCRAAQISVNRLLRESDSYAQVFNDIKDIKGARQVEEKISRLYQAAKTAIGTSASLEKALEEKKDTIRFFESHYDEYLSLKKAFNRAGSMQEKRNLVEKMSSLTMEELPALRLNPVKASLYAEIRVTKSGFLGMKKKKELVYRMTVDRNEVLPCDAVINISTEAQIRANSGDRFCISIPVEKGTSSYEGELPLPDSRLDARKTILVYLFTAPDVLDIKAIDASYATVKQQ